jgi:hypothetical protein
MAIKKLTDLSALSADKISDDDLIYVVDSPDINPISRKVTMADLKAYAGGGSATSNEVSAVSATAEAALSERASALSQAINVVSNAVSALEVRVSTMSDVASNEISNRVSVSAVLDAKISALSGRYVSGLGALSQNISTLSQAVSNEISNRTSDCDAVSAALDAKVSALSGLFMTLSNNVSTLSNAVSAVEVRLSTVSAVAVEAATSAELASVDSRITSVVNAASNAASANAVSIAGVASAALDGKISTLSDRYVSGLAALSTQISVISQQVSGISVQVNTLSTKIVRGDFTSASLSTNILRIAHNKNVSAPYGVIIAIFNNSNNQVIPDNVSCGASEIAVSLSTWSTLSGTWGYLYIA